MKITTFQTVWVLQGHSGCTLQTFNIILFQEKPLSITVLDFIFFNHFLKIGMGHPIGSLQIKILQMSFHILPLRPTRNLCIKFQLDMTILKNRYGSPSRVPQDENFSNLKSFLSIRRHQQPLYQISAFYDNFEILVHNTPPTQMTPTAQPLDRFRPSSNSFPNFVQYAYGKNFKSIGSSVLALSCRTDRQTDGRTDMTVP